MREEVKNNHLEITCFLCLCIYRASWVVIGHGAWVQLAERWASEKVALTGILHLANYLSGR